tara:strand:- start:6111 stop:6773 length:663 start_codon:yes stop_codon:yes gene_type:complete
MRAAIRMTLAGALLLALAVAGSHTGFPVTGSGNSLQTALQEGGLAGYAFACALSSLLMALGAPRQVIAAMAGYALGVVPGTLFALLCSIAALSLTYGAALFLFQPALQRRLGVRGKRLSQWLSIATFRKTLVVRLAPVGNNFLTNLLAGAMGIHYGKFLTGSLLGYLPQTVIFALVGSGIALAQWQQLVLGGLLLALASALGAYLLKTHPELPATGVATL